MKTRTALVIATLLLLAVSAFAEGPARAGIDNPDRGSTAGERAKDANDLYSRVPQKPFIYDGVDFPAGTRLPDVGLTWVITREDHKNNTFHVFSSQEVAQAFMKKRTSGIAEDGTRIEPNWPGGCSWTNSYTRFEKSRFCGDSAWLSMYPPSGEYSQLDSISWNNSISCVYAACDWYWTVLYSCRYFSLTYNASTCADPDRLYIEGGLIVGDLDDFGFNNRTSSTRFE